MEHISIGTRVECEGYVGTVLYIGEIPGTKGVWLGVEWDDPARGKHDGTHEGIRYFTTKYPNSGSFIRPKKATFGRSFMDALRDRYGMKENEKLAAEEMFVVGKNNKMTKVEFVGAELVNMKQSEFKRLVQISLRQCQVSSSGEIKNAVPAVEELDLSKNLFNTWCPVADICCQLPALHELNLSENRLSLPDVPSQYSHSFCKVRTVYLNRMDYSWDEILSCTEILQHLQQLHVCFNNIHTISKLGQYLGQLEVISLEGNAIKDWNEVLKFGELPYLQRLLLDDTKLTKIEFPDVGFGQKTRYFPKLESLSISANCISEWSSINELGKLANLNRLMFKDNPLLTKHDNQPEARTLIIAKLAKLKIANMSEISRDERRDAELDYLKMYGKAWRQSGGHQDPKKNKPNEEFIREHPRYQELIDIYGASEDSELKEHSTALKNSLITVLLDSPCLPNKAPVKKKLPVSMTVQKLKNLAQRLYKADPVSMTITYTSQKMEGTQIRMDSDQKEIGYYSIEDGDTIHVSW